MTDKTLTDVIDAHHDKLDEHTLALRELKAKNVELAEKLNVLKDRIAKVEIDTAPTTRFAITVNDWVKKIKDFA